MNKFFFSVFWTAFWGETLKSKILMEQIDELEEAWQIPQVWSCLRECEDLLKLYVKCSRTNRVKWILNYYCLLRAISESGCYEVRTMGMQSRACITQASIGFTDSKLKFNLRQLKRRLIILHFYSWLWMRFIFKRMKSKLFSFFFSLFFSILY